MKRALIVVLLGGLGAVATGDVTMLSENQQAALTAIDSVPSKAQLQQATLVVPDDLITIAANVDQKYEPGVRLRAISGIAVYCTTVGTTCPDGSLAHTTLTTVISDNAAQLAGSDLVVLRGAIEALGELKVPNDDVLLYPLLNHPSRDIRAATARAFGVLCNTAAINSLRIRYQNESTDQVKLAISETLRILSQPGACQ